MQIKFKGIYRTNLYENPKNGWGVYLFYDQASGLDRKVVGYPSCMLMEDMEYDIVGVEQYNASYGKQLQLQSIKMADNPTIILLQKYVDGIGPKTAQKLYADLGSDCLNILMDSSERIREYTYIPARNRKKIIRSLKKLREKDIQILLQIITFFHGNISSLQLNRIALYCTYGEDFEKEEDQNAAGNTQEAQKRWKEITENPYILMTVIPSFQFRQADRLAIQAGLRPDSGMRIQAAILYGMKTATAKIGSVCLSAKEIYESAADCLVSEDCKIWRKRKRLLIDSFSDSKEEDRIEPETENEKEYCGYLRKTAENLEELTKAEERTDSDLSRVVHIGCDYYLPNDYKDEKFCASNILRLLDSPKKRKPYCELFN